MADASLLPTDVWHIIIKYLSLADARSGKLVCRQWFHWLRPRVDELEREALINMVVFDEKSLRPHWTGEFPIVVDNFGKTETVRKIMYLRFFYNSPVLYRGQPPAGLKHEDISPWGPVTMAKLHLWFPGGLHVVLDPEDIMEDVLPARMGLEKGDVRVMNTDRVRSAAAGNGRTPARLVASTCTIHVRSQQRWYNAKWLHQERGEKLTEVGHLQEVPPPTEQELRARFNYHAATECIPGGLGSDYGLAGLDRKIPDGAQAVATAVDAAPPIRAFGKLFLQILYAGHVFELYPVVEKPAASTDKERVTKLRLLGPVISHFEKAPPDPKPAELTASQMRAHDPRSGHAATDMVKLTFPVLAFTTLAGAAQSHPEPSSK